MTTTPNPPSIPGLAVVAGLVAAIVAVATVLVFYRNHDRVAPGETTPDSQAESAPATQQSAALLDRDGRFLLLLTTQGLQVSGSRRASINDAHRICLRLARGESESQIVRDIVRGSVSMSEGMATAFADTAIDVYCPQG